MKISIGKCFSSILLVLLITFQSAVGIAEPLLDCRLIILNQNAFAKDVIKILLRDFSHTCVFKKITEESRLIGLDVSDDTLLISFGKKSRDSIHHFSKTPTIFLMEDSTKLFHEIRNKQFQTAIFKNPSLLQLRKISKKVLGESSSSRVFYSVKTQYYLESLLESDKWLVSLITSRSDFLGALREMKEDAVLGLPDDSIFTTESMRFMIRSLYRRRKVFIGSSIDSLNKGAVAAFIQQPELLVEQLIDMIDWYTKMGKLKLPEYARGESYKINRNIALSLDLL